VARNPERTRERILRAALKEFAAKGFAGARVEAIARRAGVNKRMLYHYFGNKQALFGEVLKRKVQEKTASVRTMPSNPEQSMPHWFDVNLRDLVWIRLLEWEALQGGREIVCEQERLDEFALSVAALREAQAAGQLAPDVDLEYALLAMLALTSYPLAMPQVTRVVTGLAPSSAEFQDRWRQFLRWVAGQLREPRRARRNGRMAAQSVDVK
jgi:AcrR family transcriptional regulator